MAASPRHGGRAVAVAVIAGAVIAVAGLWPGLRAAAARPPGGRGVLTGYLLEVGGPAIPGVHPRPHSVPGVASVFTLGGRRVSRESVGEHRPFRFVLAPGSYWVTSALRLGVAGHGQRRVTIRPGRTTRVDVVDSVP
jgi:hypothetical protein